MTRFVFSLNGLFAIDCCAGFGPGVFEGPSWGEGTGRMDVAEGGPEGDEDRWMDEEGW